MAEHIIKAQAIDLAESLRNIAGDTITNAFIKGIEGLGWISVKDRFPEDMQERVLVATDCDSPVGNQKIDTDRYRNGEWVRYGRHVTHWMPLPAPPKEG